MGGERGGKGRGGEGRGGVVWGGEGWSGVVWDINILLGRVVVVVATTPPIHPDDQVSAIRLSRSPIIN